MAMVFNVESGIGSVDGIDEHGNAFRRRYQLTQKLELVLSLIDPGQVSARTRETCDETKPDRVFAGKENDRDRRARRFGG